MPDKRKHRGPAPGDDLIFEHRKFIDLKAATADMSMLLTRGYPVDGSLKLVGDRFNLTARQRMVVKRASCSDLQAYQRERSCLRPHLLEGEPVAIDGFNILITVESLLAGGYIFIGKDGCYRDLAAVHSTYRQVVETLGAMKLICKTLAELKVGDVLWYFDAPVSNSGKLKQYFELFIDRNNLNWQVELVNSPDKVLSQSQKVVITTDSNLIDNCFRWFNLMAYMDQSKPRDEQFNILDLS